MDIESLKRFKRAIRPTYILFSLETESSGGHLEIYTTFHQSRGSVEGEELLEIITLEVFKFVLVNDKYCVLVSERL